MSLSFHIDFNGRCQEAFEYYAKHLGGTIGTMLRFKDSPAASSVPEHWQHKIVHANIVIKGVSLAGADLSPDQYRKPTGFYLLLGLKTQSEVKSAFATLADGGETIMAPQKTFWSPCYAIVVDQYGVPWKLNGDT